jgi:L-iditol 2-dehydrogenase
MKQAVMTRPGNIEYRDIPIPAAGDDEIEVQMKFIGVCGSDVHVWHGKHPYTSYPVVQGHEVSCIVTKTGKNVTNVRVGDAVTIQPQVVCKTCYPCTHGLYNDCEHLKLMGFQTTGMASDYFVTKADKALKLPNGMRLEHGALIEPLAVAVHALGRFGDVYDKQVLVIGGGPIGNLVSQAAKAKGARQVLLSEISAYRRSIAETCGIHTINPVDTPISRAITELFGVDGADCILECIGNLTCIREAIEIARKGSDIVIVGVVPEDVSVNFGFIQDHELRISGTAMYREEDYLEAISLVGSGAINFDALISHRVPFSDYENAYRIIEHQKDRAMKILIEMDQ